MHRRLWILFALLAVFGCESAPERPDSVVAEEPIAEVSADAGATVADADSAVDAAIEKPAEPETAILERRGDVVEFADGSRVTLVRNSHKHRVGGGSVGIWGFLFEKNGEEPIEFEIRGERLHAEGEAFGRVYGLKWKDGVVQLTLFPSADAPWSGDEIDQPFTGEPLSRDAAVEIARSKIEELELDSLGPSSSISSSDGVLVYTGYSKENAPIVEARVGLYTAQVEVEVDRDAEPIPRDTHGPEIDEGGFPGF